MAGLCESGPSRESLIGLELLERKEKADQEFQKEIQFLRKCFEGDEHQAQQLTQLRLAKEINESILDQYDLIRKAEPSMVYRRVGMDLCVHI